MRKIFDCLDSTKINSLSSELFDTKVLYWPKNQSNWQRSDLLNDHFLSECFEYLYDVERIMLRLVCRKWRYIDLKGWDEWHQSSKLASILTRHLFMMYILPLITNAKGIFMANQIHTIGINEILGIEWIETCKKLKYLRLHEFVMSNKNLTMLSSIFKKLPSELKLFQIVGNSDSNPSNHINYLQNLSHLKKLRHLALFYNVTGEDFKNIKHFSKLKTLSIMSIQSGNNDDIDYTLLPSTLTRLELGRCTNFHAANVHKIHHLIHLKYLKLTTHLTTPHLIKQISQLPCLLNHTLQHLSFEIMSYSDHDNFETMKSTHGIDIKFFQNLSQFTLKMHSFGELHSLDIISFFKNIITKIVVNNYHHGFSNISSLFDIPKLKELELEQLDDIDPTRMGIIAAFHQITHLTIRDCPTLQPTFLHYFIPPNLKNLKVIDSPKNLNKTIKNTICTNMSKMFPSMTFHLR